MTRRAVHGVAALFVVAALVVLPGAAPASAAPVQPLCTVDEWQSPAKFADCAGRLGDTVGRRVDCLHAPTPSSPDAGTAGWLTSRPDADLRSGVVGRYTRYGVGGYRLEMYDVSCAGGLTHPDAVAENAIASIEFNAAATVIGAANGLRENAYNPGGMWSWSDGTVKTATQAAYNYVFSIFGMLALACAGAWLIWRARQGNLSEAVRVTGWALLVMVAVTGIAKYPVAAAHGADRVAVTALTAMHSVLGPAPADIPADKCAAFDPEACRDHRTVAVRASDVATDAVLYRNWLRAVLGNSDSNTARKYGPALFAATTFTWGEAADLRTHPEARATMVDRKANQWISIAEAIKTEDPEAYENLQGLRGTDRVGTGFVALLSALIFAGFDMAASIVILLGFLVFRLAVVMAPTLATVGILQPASAGLRRLFHSVVSAVVNIVLFGAGAGLYLTVVSGIFGSGLPGAAQIVGVFLAGLACWMLLRPVKRLAQIGGCGKPDEDGNARSGWLRRGVKDAGRPAPSASDPKPDLGRRPRPETTAGRRA